MTILYDLFGSPILSLFFSILSGTFLFLIMTYVLRVERSQVFKILLMYYIVWGTAHFIYRDITLMP